MGAPLLVGGLVYIGWRSDALVGWSWAAALELSGPLGALSGALRSLVPSLPAPVLFTFPDALWVYALAWSLAVLSRGATRVERAAWWSVPILFGPGAEAGQGLGLVPGTYDPLDLVACGLALLGAAWTGGGRHSGCDGNVGELT